MRRIATFAALAVPSLLAAGIGAPAALAVDDCPNAAVRAQQQSQHLPNCMAYERVSPEDKNGAAPVAHMMITDDGNRLLYTMSSGLEDSKSFLFGDYRASRGAEGWLTDSLNFAFDNHPPILGDDPDVLYASDDLERVGMYTPYSLHPNDQGRPGASGGNTGSKDVYIREPDGSFTWVTADPSVPDTSVLPVESVGASKDLERVLISTRRQFDPRVTTTDVDHVYVWTRSGTHLATILPNGDLPTVLPSGARQASADGRRLAFIADDDGTARLYARLNADNPSTAVTREVAVGPNGEQCTGSGATLLGFSADGTKVLFSCNSALTPGAPAYAVYLRDLDGGPSAVRFVGSGNGPNFLQGNADFSRIYVQNVGFAGSMVLIRDGVAEEIATGTPRIVGEGGSAETEALFTAASPDGEYFAFHGRHDYDVPGVDLGPPGTGLSYGQESRRQVYRYSARTGELICMSCQQDGSPTTGGGVLRADVDYVTVTVGTALNAVGNNGAVAFSSTSGLEPSDTNGVYDAYAWVEGKPRLLSGGRNADPSMGVGATPDGSAFVLTSGDALVPDDGDGGAYDLYMTRPGGGFLVPDAPSVCTSDCKGSAPERPSLPGLGSTDVLGRGNLVEETTTAKAPARTSASLTVSRSVRGTSTKVRVKVSRAGSIRVSGAGLRQATVKAKKAGTYRVTVRLSANGIKQQRKRGRLATKVTARFTPQSGASVTARKSVTFTAKKGGR